MTVVLEAEATPLTPAIPPSAPHDDAAEALEDIIAAHRAALVALAPHQAWRSVRVDTGWHMEELGLLLGLRDTLVPTQKAPPGLVPNREGREESAGTDRCTR